MLMGLSKARIGIPWLGKAGIITAECGATWCPVLRTNLFLESPFAVSISIVVSVPSKRLQAELQVRSAFLPGYIALSHIDNVAKRLVRAITSLQQLTGAVSSETALLTELLGVWCQVLLPWELHCHVTMCMRCRNRSRVHFCSLRFSTFIDHEPNASGMPPGDVWQKVPAIMQTQRCRCSPSGATRWFPTDGLGLSDSGAKTDWLTLKS